MKIKHSKYKNTGLIYELLIKQIASDTLSNNKSSAISILKKYFGTDTLLSKEYRLYETIQKNKGIDSSKAESILSTITEISRRLDYKLLRKAKYNLISEIKGHYELDQFFSIKSPDYKVFAALYCLLEAQNNNELVDPKVFIDNKSTILEHLTHKEQNELEIRDSLVEEYGKYDKDLKLLTYKILLEKFNDKYKSLTTVQKEILREFIVSVNSTAKLRDYVNLKLEDVKNLLSSQIDKVDSKVIKIKLQEIIKNINPISKKEIVDDFTLSLVLEYYELNSELESL